MNIAPPPQCSSAISSTAPANTGAAMVQTGGRLCKFTEFGYNPSMPQSEPPDWRNAGVRVVTRDRLDANTPQTPGMQRAVAIDFARVGSQKLWAGSVIIQPNAKTGAHHHG